MIGGLALSPELFQFQTGSIRRLTESHNAIFAEMKFQFQTGAN